MKRQVRAEEMLDLSCLLRIYSALYFKIIIGHLLGIEYIVNFIPNRQEQN